MNLFIQKKRDGPLLLPIFALSFLRTISSACTYSPTARLCPVNIPLRSYGTRPLRSAIKTTSYWTPHLSRLRPLLPVCRTSSLFLFYSDRLGLYPYVEHGQQFHGSIPEKGNLALSLKTALPDTDYFIRSLSLAQSTAVAGRQFPTAARNYMEDTLRLGTTVRLQYLWGCYSFPHCYNYNGRTAGYTGECPAHGKSQNDELP
ncbi:hypothetical protein Z043_123068 [Scleropages formosus]|uniref:Hyaluronidase n=1 Tax=Scleropages formosus TaxID=113540 RepID=A0A0P7TMU9_SCLFO|nr:hypothetical protein Z043_123068 [Scleropages formosus]